MTSHGHLEMDLTSRDNGKGKRRLSPVPSPIDDRDILKYLNELQLHRESVFIECSDPGVAESQAHSGSRSRRISSGHVHLGSGPSRATGAVRIASTNPKSASASPRDNPEIRWQNNLTTSVLAVPFTNRRRQLPRTASHQGMISKRTMPETIPESPPSPARLHRSGLERNNSGECSTRRPQSKLADDAVGPTPRKASLKESVPLEHIVNESPLQMFDRVLRFELDRIKEINGNKLGEFVGIDADLPECTELPGIREAAMQFARARAACEFDAAVRAAEAASSEAPPEMAEEAAITGAKEYRTEIVDEFQDVLPGDHLVEVVGYVGVTRPINRTDDG